MTVAKHHWLRLSDRCASSQPSPLDWYLESYRCSSGVKRRMTTSLPGPRLPVTGSLPDKQQNGVSRSTNLQTGQTISIVFLYYILLHTSHNSSKCLFYPQEPDICLTEHLHVVLLRYYMCHQDSGNYTIRSIQASKKLSCILQQGRTIGTHRRMACLLCRSECC